MAEGRFFCGAAREGMEGWGAQLAGLRNLERSWLGVVARGTECLANLPVKRLEAPRAGEGILLRRSYGNAPLAVWPRRDLGGLRTLRGCGGRNQVLGASAAARLGKTVQEAPCSASDARTVREVPISLGNRNCCHGRSCIRKGCIPCLRKSF